MQKFFNHFKWSNWISVGEQLDNFSLKRYDILKSVNENGLVKYKRILKVKSSLYCSDTRLLPNIKEEGLSE